MTVTTTNSQIAYAGNGTSRDFAFPYYFLAASDIQVYLDGALQSSGFTVTGAGIPSGGTVSFVTAPGAGIDILLLRNPDTLQQTHFPPNDPFPSAANESAVDKLTMICQFIVNKLSKTLTFPIYETAVGALAAAGQRASTLLGFDPNGDVSYYPLTASVGAGDLRTDTFVSGVHFTPGVSTQLTLSRAPGSASNVAVFFDGFYQGPDQWSVAGTTLTFGAPIPVGVNRAYVRTGTTLSIGTPSTGTVADDQIAWGTILNRVVDSPAALMQLDARYARAFLSGYYGPGTGGAGMFWRDGSDTTTPADGGAVFVANDGARWKRIVIGGFFSPRDFGAKGDWNGATGTDDSAALQSCFSAAAAAGIWVDGEHRHYRMLSDVTVTASTFKLRNLRLALTSDYSSQGRIILNVGTVELRSIYADGGRGTYKSGSEKWVSFASFNGYTSIEPAFSPVIDVQNYGTGASARVVADNVHMANIFAVSGLNVGTYGTVQISNCVYRNVANCAYSVYHSPDNGATVAGRTQVENVYAENVGLLPTTFLVDGVSTNFATTTALPQGSFTFLVSFGDYSIDNAVVWNYGACGVTADRNTVFNGSNIYVRHTDVKGLSNNPSGAIWDESCGRFNLSNAVIDIQARDPRDYAQDSCALQLFVTEDQQVNLSNIILRGNQSSAVSNRAIRGSVFGTAAGNNINAENVHIDGLYVTNAVNFAISSGSVIRSRIRMSQMYVASGHCNFDQPNVLELTGIQTSGDVTVSTSGNPGISGAVAAVSMRNSNIANFNCAATVAGTVSVCDNETISGNVSVGACTGQAAVCGNDSIGGTVNMTSGSSTSGSFEVCNNAQIGGITTVFTAKSAIVNGNMTQRRIEIKDAQIFTVSGNTAKTDQPESIVLVNPVVNANVLAGAVTGNNLLVKTGTVGAGFISIPGPLAGAVLDSANNKLTVAWS